MGTTCEGMVALVTGASQGGTGTVVALRLAAEGAKVAITARTVDGLEETKRRIEEIGGECLVLPADLADPDGGRRDLVPRTEDAFGPIDILVNNAGIALMAPFQQPASGYLDAWNRTFDVDLTAHVLFIQACLADLQRNGEGRVVNIASTEGLGATAANSPYVAAKHGVIGLTKGLAVELGRTGVTFNCVCPGPIRTGMTAGIPDDAKDKFARRRVPLRRYGEPEEVAHMTLSLVLPAASFTNGVVVPVDGGMTSQNT